MVIEIVALSLAALCLISLGVLVVGKLKRLALLDLDAMPDARMKVRKHSLIEERLERKLGGMRGKIKQSTSPAWLKVKAWLSLQYKKLINLEEKYRQSALRLKPKTLEEKEKSRQRVALLVEDGKKLVEQEQYVEAEKKFIEAVSIDPKQVEAFEYLGEIYYYQKDFDHALETLSFAQTLNPKNDRIFLDMGTIKVEQGRLEEALLDLKKAVELSPNNPKNLNTLLDTAISAKRKFEAQKAFEQLAAVNPENQKLPEYKEVVEKL